VRVFGACVSRAHILCMACACVCRWTTLGKPANRAELLDFQEQAVKELDAEGSDGSSDE